MVSTPTVYVVILIILTTAASYTLAIKPGGISDEERPIDPELKEKLEQVQPQVEAAVEDAINGPVWKLTPVSYKSQVVAGAMYYVKYKLNDSSVYFHAKIFRDLKGQMNFEKLSRQKTDSDPIMYMP